MKCYVVIDTNVVLSALMYAQKFKGAGLIRSAQSPLARA